MQNLIRGKHAVAASLLAVTLCLCCCMSTVAQSEVLAKLSIDGTDYFGMPLGWDGKQMAFLAPDGKLSLLPMDSKEDLKIVSKSFQSYTPVQLRQQLQAEFGKRYDVSTTDGFVVAHPWGAAKTYASPFEKVHSQFVDFVQSHGVELKQPKVPLVVVVLRSRSDFERSLLNEVSVRDARIRGYYSNRSNRITTYDPTGLLRGDNDQWIYSVSSIIHEATHQSAFNTGLHNRFAPPPKWMSEGFATMFEARGFHNSKKFPQAFDRVNQERLKLLRRKITGGKVYALLLNLIDNDRIFEVDVEAAYALSWGLSFYLYQQNPKRFIKFLLEDAKRKNFEAYDSNQRLQNFAQAFGNDFEKLTNDLIKYYAVQR